MRVPVEWVFAHVVMTFPRVGDPNANKQNSGFLLYRTAVFLRNVLVCFGMANEQVAEYFDCQPPTVEEYVNG
jgi:hypothetical protein